MRSFSFQKIAIASILLFLAACGRAAQNSMIKNAIEKDTGAPAKVDVQNDGSMHIETKGGTYDAGNSRLPPDWPSDVTVYANATIQYAGSVNPNNGKPGAAAVLITSDVPDTVVAFYKTDLRAKGWTMSTAMEGQGTSILSGTKGDRTVSVMVSGTVQGQTNITLAVEKGQ